MADNKNATLVAKTPKVEDQVLSRISELANLGFTMPKDFNYVNAVKMSMLKLQEVKDRNGRPALEVCTPQSIATALFKMCTKGLNIALNQAYAIVRGDQLCIDDSYFGKVLQVKRIFPDWEPYPHTVREGDVFEFEIDPKTGHRHLIKHEQTLTSMDKDIIAAYVILPTKEGDGDLYVMTKKQILSAWSKSASKEMATHKAFDEKMAGKTVVNSGCNMIINSTPTAAVSDFDPNDPNAPEEQTQPETPIAIEDFNIETGEVQDLNEAPVPAPASQPEPEAPATAPAPSRPADDDF